MDDFCCFSKTQHDSEKDSPKSLTQVYNRHTDHFLFHAQHVKSPIFIQKIEFDKTLADYLISVKFNPQKINQIKEKYR